MSYDVCMLIDTGGAEPAMVEDVGNYTGNVAPMWATALGVPLAELHGKLGAELIPVLERAVSHIRHPENAAVYREMDPANGWGDHDGAAAYLEMILAACRRHPKAFLYISR